MTRFKEEIEEFNELTGSETIPVSFTGLSISNISEKLSSVNFWTAPLEELERFMLEISAYTMFINSQKSKCICRIKYIESELNKELYLETSKLLGEGKYYNKEERLAVVYKTHNRLNKLDEQLTLLRIQYSKLKDIPEDLKNINSSIRMIYNRRRNGSA